MSDETPWAHLQRLMAEQQPFEAALPGLQAHALTGEDMGVLLNHPTSDVVQWMRSGSVETTTPMTAVEPPADAPLPPRRTKSRGIFGWFNGVTAIEGLGHFTEGDVFELAGVQFAVLPEPLRPVAYGEQVSMRVRGGGPADEGSPKPLRFRADLKQPLVAPQQAPVLWRLMTVR